MKLRLTAAGFETYTGQMGVIVFDQGLSVGDVLAVDAIRVAGIIGAEWENGTAANVSQMYLDNMNTKAPVFNADVALSAVLPEALAASAEKANAIGVTYTEAQLGKLADEHGIAGLREISEPLGIKGNSIAGLISAVLKVAGAEVVEPVIAEGQAEA